MARRKVGILTNPFPPLERENYSRYRHLRHFAKWVRLNRMPSGPIGVVDLREHVFGTHTLTAVLITYLYEMEADGMIHLTVHGDRLGRVTYMHIVVRDLEALEIPEDAERITAETHRDQFRLTNDFLAYFAFEYSRRFGAEWLETKKDRANATRFLRQIDFDLSRAQRLVRMFYGGPVGIADPESVSFTAFYLAFPKMLANVYTETKWQEARAVGEQVAYERARPLTPEEQQADWERVHAENLKYIEEGKRLAALEQQATVEEEDDEL